MMPGFPGQPQGGSQDYDMATLYAMADHSTGFLYPEGWYSAVVEHAEYGRSKDGTKGQWTIKFRTSTGQDAGRSPVTTTLSISPVKNDGTQNSGGLGIMFRQLAALGIPVPDPSDLSKTLNGQAPFWVMRWTYEQVASAMIGRPAQIKLIHDDYDGVTRNKVRDIRPPKPGDPTTWPQTQQPQQAAQQGMFDPSQQGQYGQPQPGAFPGAVGPGVGYQGQQPQWQQPPAQPQQPGFAPAAYGQQPPAQPQFPPPPQQPQQGGYGPQQPAWGPPAGAPQAPPQQAPGVPGAPPWAQPGQPGQGGYQEFTQPGQSQQAAPPQNGAPAVPQPPWQQPQTAPQGQDPSQGQNPGQPPAPWMQ